jgi:hypothetical protein
MKGFLPIAFIVLSAGGLLFAVSFVWATLRGLLGGAHEAHVSQSAAARRRTDLLSEKAAVLRGLKDLEFEREVGKLSDEDFQRLESEFRLRAKRIIKQLDDELREHREKAEKLLARELEAAPKLEKASL